MSEQRQIKIPITGDASGFKAAAADVKGAAQDMAQAVGQAGQQAGAGLGKLGDGAPVAAQKVDAATGRMIASIQRQIAVMEAGSKSGSKFYEVLSAQRGINVDALKPYLAQLDAVNAKQAQATGAMKVGAAGLDTLGMSAKQTANNLRMIGPQFTDIITSLQGGQKPLTVLIQQGGQLKDIFGGIGPAAKALGGYVLGLVNPFTIAAAALAGIAYAAHEGASELRGFQNAALISGNAIGLSVSQFTQMRDAIAGIGGSKGQAVEALTAIARNGQLAGTNIQGIAEAAVLMEKATGQAVKKTVEDFAKLADEPAKAAAELNKQYGFLTASVYAQIKALEDQGKRAEAAEKAEKALADALKGRAMGVVENVGLMEGAWRKLAGAAKAGWDAMLNIGREKSLADRFADVSGQVAKGQGPFNVSAFGGNTESRAMLPENRAAMQSIFRQMEIEQRNTSATNENTAAQKAAIGAIDAIAKANDQYASKQEKLNKALGDYRRQLADVRAADPNSPLLNAKTIAATEAGIRKQFTENKTGAAGTGQNEVAAIKARTESQREYLSRLLEQYKSGDYSQDAKLTEGEKLVTKIQDELKTNITGIARAQKERALAEAKVQAGVDKQVASQERLNKVDQESRQLIEKQVDAAGKQVDAIRQHANEQEAANNTFGKSKTAIEQMTLAQLKQTAAQMEATETAVPGYVAALKQQVAEQERYVKALQETEYKQQALKLNEGIRVSKEETDTLQLEFSLLGQTQQVRERIVAQRKVEVALAKELAEIDKSGATDDRKSELREKARAKAQIDTANAASKSVLDEWQRTADSINQSLTDALLRGFESGKGFAQNLRDTLKNMFSTLVLSPIIKGVLSPVSGTLSGIGQSIGSAITGGGGTSILGAASGASSLFSGASALGGLAGGASLFGSGVMSGLTAWGAGGSVTGLLGSGTLMAGGLANGLGLIAGALGPIALGVGAIYALASKGGETRSGGQYTGTGLVSAPSGGEIGADAVRQAITGAQQSINDMLSQLGSTATVSGFVSGLESSKNGKGFAYAGGSLSNGAVFGQGIDGQGYMNRRGNLTADEASTAFAEELKQATIQALQAADVPGKLGEYLRSLGDVDKLSGGALDAALARINKALTERTQLEDQYYQLTHTAVEILTHTREKERAALDETNRALYDQVALMTDLKAAADAASLAVDGARGVLTDAYQRESAALQGVIDRHTNYAKQLRDLRDSLLLGDASPLSRGAKTGQAGLAFQNTLTSAIGGNEDALQGLGGAGQALLEAAKNSARSPVELAAAFAKVQAGLTTAAAASDGRVSVAQQQLDAMTQQLSALGVLNQSVVDVRTALSGYLAAVNQNLAAQSAIQQAQLQYAASIAAQQNASPPPAEAVAQAQATTPSNVVFVGLVTGTQYTYGQPLDPRDAPQSYQGFATGGLASGVAMVGENGPELVDFKSPGRVYTNDQTRGMFAKSDDTAPLMREVLSELKAARAEGRAVGVATVSSLQKIESIEKKREAIGMPPERATV